MDSAQSSGMGDQPYRTEVLLLPTEEAEFTRIACLVEEARQLGLKVPEIEAVASLAASIASGIVDLSTPVLSSGSSTDRNSVAEVATQPLPPQLELQQQSESESQLQSQSPDTLPLDQVASSLLELNISSDRVVKPRSTRSIASLSTRPTSYCSSESKFAQANVVTFDGRDPPLPTPREQRDRKPSSHRASLLSVASADAKQNRRASLKAAIGRIQFRKKRAPSAVLLPPAAQITVTRGESGVDKVFLESKPNSHGQSQSHGDDHDHDAQNSNSAIASDEEDQVLKLEIPVYDHETLQRTLEDPDLGQMRESHKAERNRHVAFQSGALYRLRSKQHSMIADRLVDNKRVEDEKREKNTADAAQIEERQLAIEMEQQRDFERAKVNSRTRIKYMEGYLRNRSPPPTPGPEPISGTESPSPSPSSPTPARQFTPQNKALLEQEYHDRDSMDQLHEAKIKVLRDRQELRLHEAIARMEGELNDLIDKHGTEFTELQRRHRREETAMITDLDARKTKMRHRWNLEEAVLRKKLELQSGQQYGPLPPLSFSDPHYDTRDSAICVSDNAGTDEEQVLYKR